MSSNLNAPPPEQREFGARDDQTLVDGDAAREIVVVAAARQLDDERLWGAEQRVRLGARHALVAVRTVDGRSAGVDRPPGPVGVEQVSNAGLQPGASNLDAP
eukprot:5006834-Prymnesium_polylepis.1